MNYKLFCLIVILGIALAPIAFAHEGATDDSVSAVLHVEPNDNPIAGRSATFNLEFKDKSGRLDLKACDCAVALTRGDKTIYSGAIGKELTAEDKAVAFEATPPEEGAYTVTVDGKPVTVEDKHEEAFEPFHLTYAVNVASATETKPASPVRDFITGHGWHLGLFIFASLWCVALVIRDQRKGRESK